MGITRPAELRLLPDDMDDLRRDSDFILSLEEGSERYAKANHPRTIRTLQRYYASGHLDAQKMATTLGDKYLVTRQSVERHVHNFRCA